MLLDANSLFLPVRGGFPLESEVDRHRPGAVLVVPSSVRAELDRLVERRTPEASAARALASRFPEVAAPGKGDDAIVRLAARDRAWVVTADRALRQRLLRQGVSVLAPRDRQRLELFRGTKAVERPLRRRRPGNG